MAGALTRSAWHGRCFGAQRASVGDITAALGAETGTDGAWAKGALAGMAAGAPLSRAATLAHYRAGRARGLNPLDTVRLRRAPRAARRAAALCGEPWGAGGNLVRTIRR